MVGTIGSLGHIRGWICLGSGHPFAKGNSRSRGTGKVQISTRQAAGRPILPVSFPFRVTENNNTWQFERDHIKMRYYNEARPRERSDRGRVLPLG